GRAAAGGGPRALSRPRAGDACRRPRWRGRMASDVSPPAAAPSVAVIGLGFGRAHVPAFHAAGARVVAVCQRDEAAARKVAAAYGVPQVYPRWEPVLASERPEIVVIATPPHVHRPIAHAAAAAGAHVLCEKPLATSREDAEAIVADVARAKRIGMTGFNWRFPAAMQRMRALMADGLVGELASGAQVSFLASRAAHGRNEHTLEISGTRGALAYHLTRDEPRWYTGRLWLAASGAPFRPVDVEAPPVDGSDPMDVLGRATITPLAVRLLAAIRGEGPADPSLVDGLRAQLVLEAAREAAARHVWIDVPPA